MHPPVVPWLVRLQLVAQRVLHERRVVGQLQRKVGRQIQVGLCARGFTRRGELHEREGVVGQLSDHVLIVFPAAEKVRKIKMRRLNMQMVASGHVHIISAPLERVRRIKVRLLNMQMVASGHVLIISAALERVRQIDVRLFRHEWWAGCKKWGRSS